MRKELIMTRTLCVFIIILVILLSSMTLASANDGVLGMTPDGVYPITQTDIMMKSEEIYIKVTGASAKVTCKFVFKNLSHAQTVLMGFPARLDIDLYEGEFTTEEDISVRNFTARRKNSGCFAGYPARSSAKRSRRHGEIFKMVQLFSGF